MALPGDDFAIPAGADPAFDQGARARGTAVELTVLSGDLARDDELVAAFCAHAALIRSASNHSGMARVYECGRRDDGTVLLAAEHPAGPTLREVIEREGRLVPERAVWLAIQIAEVLERVHSIGLVHGGLRPDNVVLTTPREAVVLTQVGVEWLVLQRTAGSARASASSAPPAYWAPEQATWRATERSDVYAIGAILYEMLAGNPPPESRHQAGEVHALRALRPEIAPSLARTIKRALDPVPEARQADASVLCNDLWDERNSHERDFPGKAKPASLVRGYRLRVGTWARCLATLGVVAGAGMLGAWLAHPLSPVGLLPLSRQVPSAPVAIETSAAVAAAPRTPAASRSPNSATIEPPSSAPPEPAASRGMPGGGLPSAVRPPQSSPPPARGRVESLGPHVTPPRPADREREEDPTAIIDWLLSEGARQRP